MRRHIKGMESIIIRVWEVFFKNMVYENYQKKEGKQYVRIKESF